MVPQGPPGPLGGGQSIPLSLLRANSGLLGGQPGGLPSQIAFPSMVSPRNQFNNMNIIGNVPNVSSLPHQSFGNGGPIPGPSGPGSSHRGFNDGGAESDPLSSIGNGMGFNNAHSSYMSTCVTSNPNLSGLSQGQQQQFSDNSGSQMLTGQQQGQQLGSQNFQHNQQQQISVPSNPQQQPHQPPTQQSQAMRGGLRGAGPVKVELQATNEQAPQQLQALHNIGSVKLEPQQLQGLRSAGQTQNNDPSLFLHQPQQQQLVLSRQSSQVAASPHILPQQRFVQMQQRQPLKSIPQQRSPLQPQFQPQNLPNRSPLKPVYEPGTCARRLTHYIYQQQHRPEDNNIEFWRKFVAEYFALNAKKKWCFSMYGSGRQPTGVPSQDFRHCDICNRKPGRGFETTAEVLPRLFKIKYESGPLEELLYVDMPLEYQNASGQIVLDYAKAIQESVFEQLRVVREGQLRIVFSPDLKICSWEFCARRHEELIPRRLLTPQVNQLGSAAQKCQAAAQNASSSVSASELQNNCNMIVSSARQLAKALEVPLVNDLGYTKRYVRCLQISEVVNSMKDLIDYSRETGTGPMESLIKFSQRTKRSTGFQDQPQQTDGLPHQQTTGQDTTNNPAQTAPVQAASSNGNLTPTTSSNNPIVGLLHQNSIKQQNPISNCQYGGNTIQMPSPGSSSTTPQAQSAPSPFQSPTPSSSNNPQPNPHSGLSGLKVNSLNIPVQQEPSISNDADANDSQSSVQKIIHDMMVSSQHSGAGLMGMGTVGSGMKHVNGTVNGSNNLAGHGVTSDNPSIGGTGFRNMSNGLGESIMVNGIQGNNLLSMNERVGVSDDHQQQDMGNQLLNGLEAVNGFNDFEFDWKPSP